MQDKKTSCKMQGARCKIVFSCHGRTASYPTAPAQIPACGTTALGSSEILASVKDKLVLPSLLFPAVRFAFVTPVLLARQMFPLQATYSVSPFLIFMSNMG